MIIEIDHLLSYVSSLDAAAETYRQLGFTLTPVSDITAMGIANRLVPFRSRTPGAASFIEMMAVTDPQKLPPPMARLLSGDEGGKSMVLATTDAVETHRTLVGLGYPFAPPVHIKREWKISPKESVFPEFDVLLPLNCDLPFNACQYRDAGVYVRDEWLTHANTALYLEALTAEASVGLRREREFAGIFGAQYKRVSADRVAITLGRTSLEITTSETASAVPLRARYTGVRVRVQSASACRRHLDLSRVSYSVSGTDIIVPPEACHGVRIVFRAGG
jgi:hypothetical protein